MGVDVVRPLQLRRWPRRQVPSDPFARPRQRIGANAALGMGLWALLWLGYNTGPEYFMDSSSPASLAGFIHGVRAFFPMLAAWLAIALMLVRSSRVFTWLMGPLGLMLLYAATGLVSSATLSPDPINALYFGANYLSIVLVLLAIVAVEDPLADLRRVLNLTWIVGIILTLGLLGAIPILGSQAIVETEPGPVGMRVYNGSGTIMGMAATRNTGFARYAAVSALVALPGLMRKGKLTIRMLWGCVFAASMYALVIANGRTETLAFVGGVAVILGAEKAKRTVNFLISAGVAILLGLRGFFYQFYLFITRTGHVDITMTGRTVTWDDGLHLLWKSPWVGFGFQADRYFLGQHMHNAFLHVLVQSGLLGGGAILVGLAIVWYYLIKYFFIKVPADRTLVPPEIPAVFLFVTISSIAESTFAYFSAAWLLSAPIVAYVMALHRRQQRIFVMAVKKRSERVRLARRDSRILGVALKLHTPTSPGGRIPD